MTCEDWQRRMFAKFREKGLSHITCGRPWTEHGDLGECPSHLVVETGEEEVSDRPSCDRCGGWLHWCKGLCP